MESRELKASEQAHYFTPVAQTGDIGEGTKEIWLLLHFTDYEGLLKNYSEVSNVLAPYLKPYFNSSTVSFKKLIKRDKYLKDSAWVKLLLEEGRLEDAVERAKVCLSREINESGEHSYTKVFKAFE